MNETNSRQPDPMKASTTPDLPSGWVAASLGQLIEINPKPEAIPDDLQVGFVPMALLGKSFREIPEFQVRTWSDVKRGYTNFRDGDVLLAKITPCFENGKAGIACGLPNGIGAGSTEYFVCRPRENSIDSRYLLAFLKRADFLNDGAAQMTGSVGHKRVPKDFVEQSVVPLPPLPEQKRIADKLDRLLARMDACRERLDRVPALLKRFRQSVLAAATSGELTREWREEHGVDHDWPVVELEGVAHDFSYGSAAKSSKSGGVPVLRMGNIQDGSLDWQDLVFTSDAAEIAKYKLSDGDVLFNRTNSPELVGKSAVFRGKRDAIYAGYLIRVRCGAQLLPDYLNYCLGSPAGREYCWQVKSDGVSQSNINARKLAAFTFGLPSLEEQREIIRRVEDLFALKATLNIKSGQATELVGRLTPATLAKAFRGELIPQDPTDEPAAALLARIASQAAESPVKVGLERVRKLNRRKL